MRRVRRCVAAGLGLSLALVLGTVGCRDTSQASGKSTRDDEPAAGTAEEPTSTGGPPRTADCRSWEDLDLEQLPELPDSPYRSTFETVWSKVLEHHYDPTLGCLDWPAIRRDYGARLAEVGSEAEAFEVMNEMLGTLGQSHLRVIAPYRPPPDAHGTDGGVPADDSVGPAIVPFRFVLLDQKAYVIANEVDGRTAEIPTGAQLETIGSRAVADAIASGRHIGARGVERTLHATRAVQRMLRCPVGATKTIGYLDPGADDALTTIAVPCHLPEGERVSLGNLRDLPTRVAWEMLPDEETGGLAVGYLAFNYWMVPMVSEVRRGVDELRQAGMEALILDLRGNPGGVGAMSIPVARMFLSEPGDLGQLRMRGMTNEFKVEPDPEPFTGPVVLLVDEGTASTSEIFAVGMRDMGRVKVVGASNSAGLALPSLMESLPDGGVLQYVVGDYHSPKGTTAEGDGVAPDVRVKITREALIAGRDPVLDAAVQSLVVEPPRG